MPQQPRSQQIGDEIVACTPARVRAREQERAGRRAGFSRTSSSHGGVCFRISSCLWLRGLLLSACPCEDIRLSRASHACSRLLPLGWSPRGAILRRCRCSEVTPGTPGSAGGAGGQGQRLWGRCFYNGPNYFVIGTCQRGGLGHLLGKECFALGGGSRGRACCRIRGGSFSPWGCHLYSTPPPTQPL